ncbi:unnamed protein product [Prunus armeniaca]|uniref:Uncharacterized protein n=1 Tax=Prunus armeniaca TaxID=36596 RepID=A0A6J5UAB9_PRUAR|nr:unnamed protein product [Prunus armeniaca]
MERLRYNNRLAMEEGELTHPPRTVVGIIIHVLARMADIVGTLIQIIVDVPTFVPDIERYK